MCLIFVAVDVVAVAVAVAVGDEEEEGSGGGCAVVMDVVVVMLFFLCTVVLHLVGVFVRSSRHLISLCRRQQKKHRNRGTSMTKWLTIYS